MKTKFPTVDCWNPVAPGMYKTVKKIGSTTNLNWLAGFLPSTVFQNISRVLRLDRGWRTSLSRSDVKGWRGPCPGGSVSLWLQNCTLRAARCNAFWILSLTILKTHWLCWLVWKIWVWKSPQNWVAKEDCVDVASKMTWHTENCETSVAKTRLVPHQIDDSQTEEKWVTTVSFCKQNLAETVFSPPSPPIQVPHLSSHRAPVKARQLLHWPGWNSTLQPYRPSGSYGFPSETSCLS